MVKFLKKFSDYDITDPIVSNALIYIATYLLSLLFCIAIIDRSNFEWKTLWLSLSDCIVPTTFTLIVGSIVQNIATAVQHQIKKISFTITLIPLVFIYIFVCSICRSFAFGYFFVSGMCSVGIAILSVYSIVQLERNRIEINKSLSA